MRAFQLKTALLTSVGAAMLLAGAAQAQDYNRSRNVSVLERQRDDYDALGVRAGGFTLFPRLETRAVYSSNVYATDVNEQSDVFLAIEPSVEARSNWGRHQLNADAGLRVRKYNDITTDDQTGWFTRAQGRLDVHGESYFTGLVEAERLYEDRGAADFPGAAAKPLPIDLLGASLRGVAQLNRVRLSAGAGIRELDFDNVPTISGGVLDTRGRDRTQATGDIKVEWAISPDSAAFVQVAQTSIDYKAALGVIGAQRDSEETQVLAGANFDLAALLRGEVGVGYVTREYDAFGSVDGLAIRGKIEYFPTRLTNLTLTMSRSVEDSQSFGGVGAGGYFVTAGGVRIDHELQRNILLNAQANYETQEFSGVDREDKVYSVSVGGTYLVNRTVGLNANLGHIARNSEGLNRYRDFDETRASIGVVLQR